VASITINYYQLAISPIVAKPGMPYFITKRALQAWDASLCRPCSLLVLNQPSHRSRFCQRMVSHVPTNPQNCGLLQGKRVQLGMVVLRELPRGCWLGPSCRILITLWVSPSGDWNRLPSTTEADNDIDDKTRKLEIENRIK
jgi:hypothetical protein